MSCSAFSAGLQGTQIPGDNDVNVHRASDGPMQRDGITANQGIAYAGASQGITYAGQE